MLAGCDTGFSGTAASNQAPATELAVRAQTLVGQVSDADRFTSNVTLSWSATDPDGFVVAYELRYYPEGAAPGAEVGWTRTSRTDTTLLLPIERGNRTANVVVEVRGIDNEGLKDPSPARTVFPIRNSPPSLALDRSELPPDTTWTVASFAFSPTDPEGAQNLARLDLALNDSTAFVALPADTRFVTLVAEASRTTTASTVNARVYLGRTFQRTDVVIPGLRLGARNVLYARVADQTDTTSALVRYPAPGATRPWFVKQPRSRTVVVNDYRTFGSAAVLAYHVALVREVTGETPDVWNVEKPSTRGKSPLLGVSGEPFLRETLGLWERMVWLTNASTDSGTLNNLPYAAAVMGPFFDRGGRLMVHSQVTLPASADFNENLSNPALFLLPITSLVPLPPTLRQLRLAPGAAVAPQRTLPSTGQALPALRTRSFVTTTSPYDASDSRTLALYTAAFTAIPVSGTATPWSGPSVVASLRLDAAGQATVGLFSLPLVDASGAPVLEGADGSAEAPREAVRRMLRALTF